MIRLVLAALLAAAVASTAFADRWKTEGLPTESGLTAEFTIVEPEGFDPDATWPVLLAFPAGDQDADAVLRGLHHFWGETAEKRGWLVVTPLAGDGLRFHEGAEDVVPELLDEIARRYRVEGGRFHAAGFGVGGLSAFRAAIDSPGRFASLVVFPGGPAKASDVNRLDRLTGVRVRMFAGTKNEDWLKLMQSTAKQLARLGIDVQAATLEDEGVPPESITGDVLFGVLEQVRQEVAAEAADAGARFETPDEVLDAFQAAAARGNGQRLFECFTDDAVAYWLDPESRWTKEELQERLRPLFGTGDRLRFGTEERHVDPLPGGEAAAFDEEMGSFELGNCRASGVLVQQGGGWLIHRYALDCRQQLVLPSSGR